MEVKFYNDPSEKRKLKRSANDRGMSTIHDDFLDERNHRTDGRAGKLTFGVKVNPPDRIIKSDDELLLLLYKKRINYLDLLDLLTLQALKDHATRWQKFKALFGR